MSFFISYWVCSVVFALVALLFFKCWQYRRASIAEFKAGKALPAGRCMPRNQIGLIVIYTSAQKYDDLIRFEHELVQDKELSPSFAIAMVMLCYCN